MSLALKVPPAFGQEVVDDRVRSAMVADDRAVTRQHPADIRMQAGPRWFKLIFPLFARAMRKEEAANMRHRTAALERRAEHAAH